MKFVKNIVFEPGAIILEMDSGPPVRHPIADVLRALDIPTGLTYSQVGAIKTLANLVVVLIRTLVDRNVLDASFLEADEYNIEDVIEAIEDMGGDYGEPDLTVS